MSEQIQVGGLVRVWTGEIGQVRHVTPDGWVGVAMLNEGGRVDEWQPSQVEPISPAEAARLAVARMAK